MARIMYWNIEKFSAKKVINPTKATSFFASNRLNYIIDLILATAPDIVVVAEVFGASPDVLADGVVLSSETNAARGVFEMLTAIRDRIGDNWYLIPPIPTGSGGKREAVAVFYDANTMVFTGPYVYALEETGPRSLVKALPPTDQNLGNLRDYDKNWLDNALPEDHDDRRWPAPNGTLLYENQWAGDWQHITEDGPLLFPTLEDRKPFFVRFYDGDTESTIKLFAVHTSPKSALLATRRIPDIPDVREVGDNELAVVVGDFNVDSFIGDPNYPFLPSTSMHYPYQEFINELGYEMLLSPFPPGMTEQRVKRWPYCTTHLLPVKDATPYNANGLPSGDPRHNVYPRFGYMGSGTGVTLSYWGAIDNAFVKYGTDVDPTPHNVTIVNTVVGKPYNKGQPPPVVTAELTGGLEVDTTITPPIPLPGGIDPTKNMSWFTTANNYGLIRSVSDHLAIVFDV